MNHYLIPDWPAPARVKAYTTTRSGGCSLAPYDSFNLSFAVGDEATAVSSNRQQLIQELELKQSPHWLVQTHSNLVLPLHKKSLPTDSPITADASFSREANQICVVLTADCLPILLCDHHGTVVAAIHAGWRGLLNRIIESTIKALDVPGNRLLAWLGPAIGPTAFQVGNELVAAFYQKSPVYLPAFTETQGTWRADIYQLAINTLRTTGVTHIYGGDYCTYTQPHWFFSYRRDQMVTGRLASLIWLESD